MSVSKQFKTCLSNEIKREPLLIIDGNSDDRRNYMNLLKLTDNGNDVKINSMIGLLQIMTNIKEIYFVDKELDFDENQVLNAITDNCNNLKTIVYPFDGCDE